MIDYRYDHSLLSLVELHGAGIRTTRELEEVIEGYCFGKKDFDNPQMYILIGFTKKSKPLQVTFTVTDNADIITRKADVPTVEKIVDEFCRYCHST